MSRIKMALFALSFCAPAITGAAPPRPPEEAFRACAHASEGDACTVATPDGRELKGTCTKLPEQAQEDAGKLICMPAHLPPPR